MKRRDLERRPVTLGWSFVREGGNHRVFTKPGHPPLPVPRHSELNENTARAILREARKEDET